MDLALVDDIVDESDKNGMNFGSKVRDWREEGEIFEKLPKEFKYRKEPSSGFHKFCGCETFPVLTTLMLSPSFKVL